MNSIYQIQSSKKRCESLVYYVSFIYLCRKTNISICFPCANYSSSVVMMRFMLFTVLSMCKPLLFLVCPIEVGFLLTCSHCGHAICTVTLSLLWEYPACGVCLRGTVQKKKVQHKDNLFFSTYIPVLCQHVFFFNDFLNLTYLAGCFVCEIVM